jgi:hypothetical protein
MNPINHESTARRTLNIGRGLAVFRNGRGPRLLLAAALWIGIACATSYAQTVIGSPGAGFQHWTVGDLNNNGAPYWDAVTKSAGNTPNSANVGFCLTGTGDCGGVISHPPGPVPFWGMSFNSGTDTPGTGAMDRKVYFRHSSSEYEGLKAPIHDIGRAESNQRNRLVRDECVRKRHREQARPVPRGGEPGGQHDPRPCREKS